MPQVTYLGCRDGRHNNVKVPSILLLPVFLIVGGDVPVSAELQYLVPLGLLPRDTNDLVGPESLGEDDSEVTQTADADDTNLLPRPGTEVAEGRVDGNAAAQHGCCVLGP